MTRRIRRIRASGGSVSAHATVIQVNRADHSTSRQAEYVDGFMLAEGLGNIVLPPPYDVGRLFDIIERSNALRPCIDAYVTNTVMSGWEVAPKRRGQRIDEGERAELQSFIENANSEQTLGAVMELVVRDRESVGFGFLEGIRDATGRISLLRHAPAICTRLAPKHPQEVLVSYTIARGRRVSVVNEYRKFRRFLQFVNGKYVWFKEWGDPRRMNRNTGYFQGEEGYVSGFDASEILHFKLPSNEPYGVPRWVNQLPSIIGSREAEEVNMRYFEDNTVPPMMLTVSGGRLTASSYNELTKVLTKKDIGSKRQHKIILVEAVGEGDALDGKGTPVQLKVEKLSDTRQSDGLFQAYDVANQSKVRASWRLPAIMVGQGQETNFANAQVSVALAESQVFGPDRCALEETLNKYVIHHVSALAMGSVSLVSRVPAITSPETTVKTLTALNVMGAVTPRIAQMVANTFMQAELPEYPEKGEEGYEEWMDMPIQLAMKTTATTHDEQRTKTDEIKEREKEGNTGFEMPEHGREGEVLTE